jgi:hypothetical protein
MHAQKDQGSTSAVTPSLPGHHSRAAAWLASRPRVTGVVLAAAGWAATFAAVMAGRHLGRGAALQIIIAAIMITFATAESLLSPASPVIIDDRAPLAAARRYHRLGTIALIIGCLLGPSVGGAALGADRITSLLTSLAVACAVASVAAHRLGRHLAPSASRVSVAIRRRPAGPYRTGHMLPAERARVRGSQLEVDHVQP